MSTPGVRAGRPQSAIVIVGGGISGLTADVAFARWGLEPVIYQQAPELQEVGAGVTLRVNAFRALESIGLAGEVVRFAGGLTGWRRQAPRRDVDAALARQAGD